MRQKMPTIRYVHQFLLRKINSVQAVSEIRASSSSSVAVTTVSSAATVMSSTVSACCAMKQSCVSLCCVVHGRIRCKGKLCKLLTSSIGRRGYNRLWSTIVSTTGSTTVVRTTRGTVITAVGEEEDEESVTIRQERNSQSYVLVRTATNLPTVTIVRHVV